MPAPENSKVFPFLMMSTVQLSEKPTFYVPVAVLDRVSIDLGEDWNLISWSPGVVRMMKLMEPERRPTTSLPSIQNLISFFFSDSGTVNRIWME